MDRPGGLDRAEPAADSFAINFDWPRSFQDALRQAVLASERRRMALVAGFFGVCLAVSLVYLLFPLGMSAEFRAAFVRAWTFWLPLYAGIIVYELALRAAAGRYLRSRRAPPAWTKYANAVIEVSFPTVALASAVHFHGRATAVQILFAAPLLFYPVVVLLTTLQLDPALCAFTGFVAAGQYLALALTIPRGEEARAIRVLDDLSQHVARAGVFALAGLAAAFVAGQIRRQFIESVRSLEERNRAVSIFGQHVSPQVARKLLDQRANIGPEAREVCVMFLDIRDFTRFARDRTPEEVMQYLNVLFESMIETVNRYGGIVNKFLGDGLMAVFGAPIADGEGRRHAAQAALEIVEWVDGMNRRGVVPPTRVGIGLHAGPAVTGEVGSARRKEYTVIGDVVNLASRIEKLNKTFDSRVLASAAVVAALPPDRFLVTALGEVQVKGVDRPTAVYRLA